MRRQHARICAGTAEERRNVGRVGMFEVVDDRVLIRLVDLRNQIPAIPAHFVVRGIEHGFGREYDVVGIERRAVRPANALAQVPGDRVAVFADPAVSLRGDDREQLGIGPVLRVVLYEIRLRHLRDVSERRLREEMRIEGRHVARTVGDRQLVRRRRRRLTAFGARTERSHRYGDRREP